MLETWVWSLVWENLLEKKTKTHSICLIKSTSLENPMDRGAWQATQSMGSQKIRHNLATKQEQL